MNTEALRAVVCAIIINPEGKVLVAERPEGKEAARWWEFPGGKVERGETRGAALVRELKEELNLDLQGQVWQHFYRQSKGHLLLDYYLCYPSEALHVEALEGQRWAWLAPEALSTLRFLENNRDVVTQLQARGSA